MTILVRGPHPHWMLLLLALLSAFVVVLVAGDTPLRSIAAL